MAKREGLNSITVWMIVFVALWLASTVFLVILYTGQEDLRAENTKLRSNYAKTVNSQQERSIDLIKGAQENGPTMVGILEEARSSTAELATGEPTDAPPAIRAKRDQLLATIKADGIIPNPETYAELSYHEAMRQLYESFKAAQTVRKAAEDRAAQLDAQMTAMVEAEAKLKADFEKQARDMTEQLAQAESGRAEHRAERDKQLEELQKNQDESQKRHDAEITAARQERLAAEQQVDATTKRLTSYQTKIGGLLPGPGRLTTARTPDGQILTAVPGDNVVYIDLGRKNALTLGLKFAVYSAQTGIPEDGRGKAQIEVVSISDWSAECAIRQIVPNSIILEGDLIANPIYDPKNPMNFVVAGDFDLDRDGINDRSGNLIVEDLIRKWGGKVGDELTPLTDFVVLGVRPRALRTAGGPQLEPGQAPPPNPIVERYDRIMDQSTKFAVPVLSQEVFLNYLGYSSNRTTQR
jgi:hypothetical protein